MNNLTTVLLKIPRNTEITPESAQTFLASLTQINSISGFQKLMGNRSLALSLEIVAYNQQIAFIISCDDDLYPFIEAQIQSNYPLVLIEKIEDPLVGKMFEVKEITLRKGNYYAIATYPNFTDVDPMSSVLSVLSKADPDEIAMIQLCLESIGGSWQSSGQRLAEAGGPRTEEGGTTAHPNATLIKEKISYPGFAVSARLISNKKSTLTELASSFGVFAKADGNSFTGKGRGIFAKGSPMKNAIERRVTDNQVLNIVEIATIWHLPGDKIKIPSIIWGKAVLSEAPDNLPIIEDKTDEQKAKINFFGKAPYKNQDSIFGIKDADRRRHVWVIGKTGTGKSTLIENMVISDVNNDRGVALIDPHGDACETILDYIPNHRINQAVYFNPADKDNPITLNPLEVTGREEAELVVSGLMGVFTKIWANVWSARMEYILRNTLLTLAQIDGTTFSDVLAMLSNKNYRDKAVAQIHDRPLVLFWRDEFEKMPDRLQKEAISPIQNKVGQFVTSPLIRRVIGAPKSSIDLEQIMDEGMILLANLSVGRIGEDNSALLGATLITKLQYAAMRRVDIPEEQRRDFYLFVDEFQNFATESFIKILSEARKYRLNLMVANQYMAQIPEEIQKAILGNVGSLVAFGVGAEDAEIIHKEYSEVFSQNDLVNLSNFQIATKLMIDGHASRPFLAHTIPLPESRNQNKEVVINQSRERWASKVPIEELDLKPDPPQQQQNYNHPPRRDDKLQQTHSSSPKKKLNWVDNRPKNKVLYDNPNK